MPDPWLYMPWQVSGGAYHMGLDAAMLEAPPERPVLRLYGWHSGGPDDNGGQPGCISLGRFQRDLPPQLLDHLSGFGLTRRSTGGGAIYHWGEVTYTIVGTLSALRLAPHESLTRLGDPTPSAGRPAAYARFHSAWMAALAEVGAFSRTQLWMPAQRREQDRNEGPDRLFCFTRRTGYDVLASLDGVQLSPASSQLVNEAVRLTLPQESPRDGKIIGSAQRFRHDVLLQHGSIKVSRSPLAPWEISLADLSASGRLPDMGIPQPGTLVAERLAQAFATALGVRLDRWELPTALHDRALELARTRYSMESWVRLGRRH